MIARVWHGWTGPDEADAYERLLRTTVLPGIHQVHGFRGAHLLREDRDDEVEFVTITYFDSMEAIRAFAGDDPTVAVVPDEARALLARFDGRSRHYEVVEAPDTAP